MVSANAGTTQRLNFHQQRLDCGIIEAERNGVCGQAALAFTGREFATLGFLLGGFLFALLFCGHARYIRGIGMLMLR